jgi:Ni/Fe-hydrogenase subunit HybB-like protein
VNQPSLRLFPRRRAVPLAALAAGAAGVAASFVLLPVRTWANVLVGGFYLVSLGLAALLFLATQRLAGARWSAGLRRPAEALALVLLPAAVLLALVWLGRTELYPWSRPGAFAGASAIGGKAIYLRVPFVGVRMLVALAAWCLFAWLFRRASLAQDREPARALAHHRRLQRLAAAFAPVFALTFTTGVYDWLLSLEPSWSSTLFAGYVFAGTFVQGIAAVTLVTVVLRTRGLLGGIADGERLHDLGKMLFAFATFWAYLWLSQLLLVWYADIPEEVTHYALRTRGAWAPQFWLNLAANWAVPFLLLLSARAKRDPRVLAATSLLLLAGRWLDLHLLVLPAVAPAPALGLPELSTATACGALAFVVVARALARAPLVPVHDPLLARVRVAEPEPEPA